MTRVDYTLVGIIAQNTLQLIPPKKARDQHLICIGDANGVIQLLSVKKDEIVVHFKTVPIGSKINSIQLGGSLGSQNDRIIVAFEDHIVGYNKKGKVYMTFDTNLTEPIKTICVTGIDLIICGNHVYTHYKDFKESGTYLCGDTIVDCKVLCPNNVSVIVNFHRTLINNSDTSFADKQNHNRAGMLWKSAATPRTLSCKKIN